MSDKFLGSGQGSVNLSNGSATIYSATLGASSLDPSKPVKTNSVKQLISANLDISEVNSLATQLTEKDELTFVEDNTHTNPATGKQKIYFKTDGNLYKLSSLGVETQIGSGGGGGGGGDATGTWLFDIKTASPPDANTFIMNNTTPASATSIEIRKDDSTGNSFGVLFSTLRNGDQILFNDGTNKKLYTLTGVGINNSVYFVFPVVLEAEDNVIQFSDGVSITTTILIQNPFNQQLNTTSDVEFNSVNINSGAFNVSSDGGFTGTGKTTLIRVLNPPNGSSYSICRDSQVPATATGGGNILLGNNSGNGLTTGYSNVVVGDGAGRSMTTAQANVIVGSAISGHLIDTGNNNVIVGAISGTALTSGGLNTIIGRGAGGTLVDGNNNTLLGASSGFNLATNVNYSIALGASTQVDTDNTLVIGASISDITSINNIIPGRTQLCDIGSTSREFKDVYISGQLNTGEKHVIKDYNNTSGTANQTIDFTDSADTVMGHIKYSGSNMRLENDIIGGGIYLTCTTTGGDILLSTDSTSVRVDDSEQAFVSQIDGYADLGSATNRFGDLRISGSVIGASPNTESIASGASITPNIDNINMTIVNALATNLTINNPTGTSKEGQCLIIRIKDNGVQRTLTWGANYEGIIVSPITNATTAGKWMYFMAMYNTSTSKWDVIAETIQP